MAKQADREPQAGPDSSSAGQNQQNHHEGGGGQGGKHKKEPSRAEWVVGIACTMLVLAAVGYLGYRALFGPELPPMVEVRAQRVLPMGGGGYLVEFRAINQGSETAANLMVEGALMRDTVAVEKSTATLDFVPGETERQGGLFFTRDPGQYRLELRPTGFDRP